MTKLTVERMRWWDIDPVAALERELFAGDSPWTPGMFWAELAAGHHYVVHRGVGSDGRPQVLGYAGLAVGPDNADVQTIGVTHSVQGRGIGRALLHDLLRAAGDRPVMLEVRTDNTPAVTLYESEGFVRLGIRRRYYQPSGADAFTMRRTATPPTAPGLEEQERAAVAPELGGRARAAAAPELGGRARPAGAPELGGQARAAAPALGGQARAAAPAERR
jgi:ribosomal-protein-alanine N-acetyltransferase